MSRLLVTNATNHNIIYKVPYSLIIHQSNIYYTIFKTFNFVCGFKNSLLSEIVDVDDVPEAPTEQ